MIKHRLKNRALCREIEQRRDRLYRVALSWCHDRHTADDLVQQCLLKAVQGVDKLRSPEQLDGWLFRILANCWKDHLRSRRDLVDVEALELVGDSTPEDEHLQSQLVRRVRRAIRSLPPAQCQVVTLVDLGGLSYNEVSEVLEIPLGTVMSRLCRARQALKERLSEFGNTQEVAGQRLRRVK